MTFSNYDHTNNQPYSQIYFKNTSSAANIITKPIEKVETVINNTVDTFVKTSEDEEKKKSNKTAIAVGSTVLVLSGLVALLNPKFSGKLVNKLKSMSSNAETKINKNKHDVVKSKFYQASTKFLNKTVDVFQFTNTLNAAKDQGFKKLCLNVKGVNKIMAKPHKAITDWFDKISKHTVTMSYKNASKKMDSLEDLIVHYKDKLPAAKQQELKLKLDEIRKTREYFSNAQTSARLDNQGKIMANLEKDFMTKFKAYIKDFKNPNINKSEHIRKNMSYWAEDMMMPKRNQLEQDGIKVVDTLVGDGKAQKGRYQEILDILTPYVSQEEKALLETGLKKTGKKLRKANHSECVEYFDKKRDLILGGAPTDMVTAAFGLGMTGVAVGTADTKEDRISRALTVGFPAVAGIGASMALTAMLFSGVKGMLYGALASAGLSKIGSSADKYLNPKPVNLAVNGSKPVDLNNKKEVINA